MKGKYKAGFILPKGAKRVLGEVGWEFESSERLPDEVSESSIESLGLKYLESYLGIDVYVNETVKMSVSRDDESLIEHISFQIYDENTEAIVSRLNTLSWYKNVDFFRPNQQ